MAQTIVIGGGSNSTNISFSLSSIEGDAAIHTSTGNVVSHNKIQLTISNNGSQNITNLDLKELNLSNGQEHLAITPSENNFSLNINSNKTITFDANLFNASRGIYSGTMVVTANGVEKQITLRLTLRDATISIQVTNNEFPESEREINVTQNIAITNNGDFSLNNVQLVFPNNIKLTSPTPTAILKGESVNITVQSFIPDDQDSGKESLGTVQVIANEGTKTFDVYSNAISKLSIENIKLKIGEFTASTITQNDETFSREPYPGDDFTVTVDLENKFKDNDQEDFDIENIEIEAIFVKAGEDEDDIEGTEENEITLHSRETQSVKIDFDENIIDWDVQAGTHELIIIATGEDENGATHTTTLTGKVKIRRSPTEDIRIISYEFSNTQIFCGDEITIQVEGRNIGERDDSQARLVVSNLNLNISADKKFEIGDFLAEDCNAINDPTEGCKEFLFKETFTIPTNIATKTYPILIKTYYEHSKESDKETVNINVQCFEEAILDEPVTPIQDEVTQVVEESNSNGEWTSVGNTQLQVTTKVTPSAPTKFSFEVLPRSAPTYIVNKADLSNDDLYLPVLMFLLIIVVGGIITATTVLRK